MWNGISFSLSCCLACFIFCHLWLLAGDITMLFFFVPFYHQTICYCLSQLPFLLLPFILIVLLNNIVAFLYYNFLCVFELLTWSVLPSCNATPNFLNACSPCMPNAHAFCNTWSYSNLHHSVDLFTFYPSLPWFPCTNAFWCLLFYILIVPQIFCMQKLFIIPSLPSNLYSNHALLQLFFLSSSILLFSLPFHSVFIFWFLLAANLSVSWLYIATNIFALLPSYFMNFSLCILLLVLVHPLFLLLPLFSLSAFTAHLYHYDLGLLFIHFFPPCIHPSSLPSFPSFSLWISPCTAMHWSAWHL